MFITNRIAGGTKGKCHKNKTEKKNHPAYSCERADSFSVRSIRRISGGNTPWSQAGITERMQ